MVCQVIAPGMYMPLQSRWTTLQTLQRRYKAFWRLHPKHLSHPAQGLYQVLAPSSKPLGTLSPSSTTNFSLRGLLRRILQHCRSTSPTHVCMLSCLQAQYARVWPSRGAPVTNWSGHWRTLQQVLAQNPHTAEQLRGNARVFPRALIHGSVCGDWLCHSAHTAKRFSQEFGHSRAVLSTVSADRAERFSRGMRTQ